MEWKAQVGRASGEMAEDVPEPGAQFAVVTSDFGVGEFVVEIGDGLGGVAEFNRADAFFGGGKQDPTEIAFADGIANRESFAAIAIGEGSHAQLG